MSWWGRSNPITNVYADENIRRETGLVTKDGRKIFREPNEIGFGRKHNIYSSE